MRMFTPLILVFVFFIVAIPLILKPELDVYDAADETTDHYPLILRFSEQYPNIDLRYSLSATAPFYHILMMFFVKLLKCGLLKLRFINLFFSMLCLITVYKYLSGKWHPAKALILSLCIMLSPYFIGSSVRLSTDNFALLLLFLVIIILDRTDVFSIIRMLTLSLLVTFLVLTRQIYVWVIGLVLLKIYWQKDKLIKEKVTYMLFMLIPVFSIIPLFVLWKGLVTPEWQHILQAKTPSLNVFIYIVSLFGLYGLFFLPWFYRSYRENRVRTGHLIWIVLLSIGVLLISPMSSRNLLIRGGALWRLSYFTPVIFSNSIVFWVLFPLGLIISYTVVLDKISKKDYFMLSCIILWLVANMFNAQIFQKYYEPFLLFFISCSFEEGQHRPQYYWLGPAVLILGFFALDFVRFYLY